MRVPANSFTDSLVNQLNVLRARQYNLQNQVATGLRVNAPSDDPAAMQTTLNLVADKAANQQYRTNIVTLEDRSGQIYNVMQSLQTISSRAGELATLAGDVTKTSADRAAYTGELNQLINQAVQLANTKDAATGHALFSGTSSTATPFTAATDASGNVTSVTYAGNAAVNQVEISAGTTVAVDVPGVNNSGTGARGLFADSRSGADFFANLIKLRDDITANNHAAITGTDVPALNKDSDNLLYQISNNGVTQSRLSLATTVLQNGTSSLDQAISNQTSADLVSTMVQLSQAQNSYQAALQSGAKIMQLSILNYIS